MDLLTSIFWAVLIVVMYAGGFFLVAAMLTLTFYLFYALIWEKISRKLRKKDPSTESDISTIADVCLCCSFLVIFAIAVFDGSLANIINEITGLF